MLGSRLHTLWRSLVSWVLVVMMIASLGGASALSNGGVVALTDDNNAELYDDDTVLLDDDGDSGLNGDDDPYDNGSDPNDDDDPYDNGDPNGGGDDDPNGGGDPNDGTERRITFEFDENPVEIMNISTIENPSAFLLYGVRASDESGANVEVTIQSHDESLLDDGRFDLENLLPGAYFTVIYRAVHPATGEVFTAYRKFYVSSVFLAHSVTFSMDARHVIINNIHEIDNPVRFLLSGISASDENDDVLPVEIIDTGGLLVDSTRSAEIDGLNVFANTGNELPTEDGTGRIDGDVYHEDSEFNLEAVHRYDEFVVTFRAVHPEDPDVYETVERVFIVALTYTLINYNRTAAINVGSGQTYRIVSPAVVTGAVTVNAGGTLILESGSIQFAFGSTARGVRVNGGTFNMIGGEIRNITNLLPIPALRDTGNDRGFGVEILGAGVFNMSGGRIHNTSTAVNLISSHAEFNMTGGFISGNATNATRSPGVNITAGTFTMEAGEIYNNTHTWALNTNDGGVGVRLNGAQSSFYMYGGTIRDNIHLAGIGGGVHVRAGASFTMGGMENDGTTFGNGVISGNTAGRNSIGTGESGGGGVAVLSYLSTHRTTFTMHAGEISGNRTRTSGGGVSVRGGGMTGNNPSAVFTMNGGTIRDNEATNTTTGRGIGGAGYYSGGGGVWVYGLGATFTLDDGLIEHNRTGGYWNSWRGQATVTGRADVPTIASGNRTSEEWMTNSGVPLDSTGTGGQNQNGGGVFALRNAHFNMNGGRISHNVAGDFLRFWEGDWNRLPRGGTYHGGGGIATRNHGRVNITGGEISHNRSPSGGGIYVDNWSQVTISGAQIIHNIAYGRMFTNAFGWDGRGGGGIATGDGLYYGNRHVAHRVYPVAGTPPFDVVNPAQRHTNTAVCVLAGTVVRYNISGGDGGGIYWWASSVVRMDDERYLHGLRVTEGARVDNNLAFGGNFNRGVQHDFSTLSSNDPNDNRLSQVDGRIDDGLNIRHNLTPRHRVATSVVRNGRVNPGGMWIDEAMAINTRINPYTGHYFAGYGHHAFNNHDIRTVGGARWLRPQPLDPPTRNFPMQEISQGRVQLEIVGPAGAPPPGSDTPFPYVDMGNIRVAVRFDQHNRADLPDNLPVYAPAHQREAYAQMLDHDDLTRLPASGLGELIIDGYYHPDYYPRSKAVSVYNILPYRIYWVNPDGSPSSENTDDAVRAYVDRGGYRIDNPRTHHGIPAILSIEENLDAPRTHRVTKVEVFGACGCRALDQSWLSVIRPDGSHPYHPSSWTESDSAPDGWAPGPYLLNHFCLTHHVIQEIYMVPTLMSGADFNNPDSFPTAGGNLPFGLFGELQPIRNELPNPWPSGGDRFYFGGCRACHEGHPTRGADFNPFRTDRGSGTQFTHTLNFLNTPQPYPFRPGAGFGAYGLVFRVTIEEIPTEVAPLRLGIIGDSIDFGTHHIEDIIRSDVPFRLGGFRNITETDEYGNVITRRVRNGSNPAEIGFTVHDSRPSGVDRTPWVVNVQADRSIFGEMLRMNNRSGGSGDPIWGAAMPIFSSEDFSSVCGEDVDDCECVTRTTRVTWANLMSVHRDIVVCTNLSSSEIPPIDRHQAVLTWTVIGATAGENPAWANAEIDTLPSDEIDDSSADYTMQYYDYDSSTRIVIVGVLGDDRLITSIADTPRGRREYKLKLKLKLSS